MSEVKCIFVIATAIFSLLALLGPYIGVGVYVYTDAGNDPTFKTALSALFWIATASIILFVVTVCCVFCVVICSYVWGPSTD
jgi:hypothetical protein